MGRSRSRSPLAVRRRGSRSPPRRARGGGDERMRDTQVDRSKRRSRSSSRDRKHRRHSPAEKKDKSLTSTSDVKSMAGSSSSKRSSKSSKKIKDVLKATGISTEEEAMAAIMGFGTFNTTKNKKVEGNAEGIALVFRKRRYRQFMNRKGGFNRPLDAIK